MSQLHVLGIGSPFGDDQLGWDVVKQLQKKSSLSRFTDEQIHLSYSDRPGLYLLELMRHAQYVFLIDAIKTGAPIGTCLCFHNEAIEDINDTLSSHSLGIAAAMTMGRTLKILPKHIVLYAIEIGDIVYDNAVSPPIKQAINHLMQQIEEDITNIFLPK